jgi:hypothetical protein
MNINGVSGGTGYTGMSPAQSMAVVLAAQASMAQKAAQLDAASATAAAASTQAATTPSLSSSGGQVDMYL